MNYLPDAALFLGLTLGLLLAGWCWCGPTRSTFEAAFVPGATFLGFYAWLIWVVASTWRLVPGFWCVLPWPILTFLLVSRRRNLAHHARRALQSARELAAPDRILALYLLFLFALTFALCLAPPGGADYDSLTYHLAVPAQYLRAGRVIELRYDHHSYFPMSLEMLYALGLWARGAVFAKLFHWLMLPIGAFALIALGKRAGSARGGLLGAVLYASTPLILQEATTAYIDLGFAAFTFLATLCMANFLATQNRRDLALCGAFCGFCLGTKYFGALVFGFLGLWLLLSRRKSAPDEEKNGASNSDQNPASVSNAAASPSHSPPLRNSPLASTAAQDSVAGQQDSVTRQQDSIASEKDLVAGERDSVASEKDLVAGERDSVVKQQDSVASKRDLVASKRDLTAASSPQRAARFNRWRDAAIFALPALLFGAIWYARNAFWTGNPVYPFAYGIFGGAGWTAEMARLYDESQAIYGFGKTPLDAIWLPWRLALAPINYGQPFFPLAGTPAPAPLTGAFEVQGLLLSSFPGPALFAFGVPALLLRNKPRPILLATAFFGFLLAFWFVTSQQIRYLIPALGFLALIGGWGAVRLAPRLRLSRALGAALLTAWLLFAPYWLVQTNRASLGVISGAQTPTEYLRRAFSGYDAMDYANKNTPPGAKFAVFGEPRCFYLDRAYFWADDPHNNLLPFAKIHSGADFIAALKAQSATHLLVNSDFGRNGGVFAPPQNFIDEAVASGALIPVTDRRGYQIYALR